MNGWPVARIEGKGTPWLLLHGTGGNEHDLIPLGQEFMPGAPLISPRGQVLEHGSPRWFARFEEGKFDIPDFHERLHALATWIEAQPEPTPWNVLGFSNGANMAHGLLRYRPNLVADAVLLRPMEIDPEMTGGDLSGHRVLVATGDEDPIVPLGTIQPLVDVLRSEGAEVDWFRTGAGHRLSEADFIRLKEWLDEGHKESV